MLAVGLEWDVWWCGYSDVLVGICDVGMNGLCEIANPLFSVFNILIGEKKCLYQIIKV